MRTDGLIVGVMSGLLGVSLTCFGADFIVKTIEDTNDGLCTPVGAMIQMPCSLREAVIKANEIPGGDTIEIPPGTYHLTLEGPGEDEAATGDLNVLEDLEIFGSGSGVTRIISDLIEKPFLVISDGTTTPYPLFQVHDLTISGGWGGIGAVYGRAYLWRSVVENCSGSAVNVNRGTALIVDSVIRGNSQTSGSTIMINSGTLLMIRSTVYDNSVDGSVGNRGAVYAASSTVSLLNSTLTGNELLNAPAGSGGYFASGSTTTIDSCTIVGNSPREIGIDPGSPGSTMIRNTYIYQDCTSDTSGLMTSEGGNVGAYPQNCCLNHQTDLTVAGGDPLVLPLENFGGYSPVMLPWGVGNPLVDNPGAGAHCQSDDQRGESRPQDGGGDTIACDTGAVERTPSDYIYYWGDGFETGDTSRWSATQPPIL